MDEEPSSDPPPNNRIRFLFIIAYLGYTVTDTYFIIWLAKAYGEGTISLGNMLGALIAIGLGILIINTLKNTEYVNIKIAIGSIIYSLLEIVLYFILAGNHNYLLLITVFTLDNLALVTYSAPIETLAIKSVGKEKNVEIGALSTRMYIIAGGVGAGIAYLLYPNYTLILGVAVAFKLLTAIIAMILPRVPNHDEFEVKDLIDPDVLRNIPMTTGSEVFYLTAPVIIASMIGVKNYALYSILMQVALFFTVEPLAKSKHLHKHTILWSILVFLLPLVGFLLYYSFMNAMILQSRDDMMDEWGIDDSVSGINFGKVMAAVLAMPFVKVFGASVYVLSALLIVSVAVQVINKRRGESCVLLPLVLDE